MTIKIKTTLLTIFFLFGLLTGLQAQEKYEYAAVSYYPDDLSIVICIAGKDVKTVTLQKEEIAPNRRNLNPAMKQLQELSEAGWEWFDSGVASLGAGIGSNNYVYYLRKKRQ